MSVRYRRLYNLQEIIDQSSTHTEPFDDAAQ